MPVYSMTGYASVMERGGDAGQGPRWSWEVRSVNGRFLDLHFKLPDECKGLEPALREQATARLKRGKVEMRLAWSDGGEASAFTWAPPQAEQRQALQQQLAGLAEWQSLITQALPQAQPLSVAEVMHWCRPGGGQPLDTAALLASADRCWQALSEARAREGQRLVEVLLQRVDKLERWAADAKPWVPVAMQKQQQRFLERWHEALALTGAATPVGAQAAQERALTEAAAHAVRLDVAEELDRLVMHLKEIRRLLAAGGDIGKRLDFLIQELHREANTLGSKSASNELTSLSVDMKVAIEQMREQVQNLE